MEFWHVEDILQYHGRGLALGMHVDGNAADTSGLNGAVIAKDDVHGVDEWGIMMKPVAMCTHIARGARVDDPTSLETLRTRIDLGL